MSLITGRFSKELKAAISVAKDAGLILKKYFQKNYKVIRKSQKEMVAEVDMLSQKLIVDRLSRGFPEYNIISEEIRNVESVKGLTWVIDPVDGTHNYIAGLPFSGVSIGLADENGFYIGVIYFPFEKKLFHAVKGCGAFVNGELLSVSNNSRLDKSIVNYDNQFHLTNDSFDNFKILVDTAFTVRIFGVASFDFCLISSGIIDARVWNSTKIVDIVAGTVIVTEAGGKVTDFRGEVISLNVEDVVASNGLVHDQILGILKYNGID